MIAARRSARFTRFDGNLSGLAVPSPAAVATSATRLERWGICPFAYLLRDVLGVEEVENPEEELTITPLQPRFTRPRGPRGVHRRGARASAPKTSPRLPSRGRGRPRADGRDRRTAVRRVTSPTALTGRPVFWHRDRRRIIADLLQRPATSTIGTGQNQHPSGRGRAGLRFRRARGGAGVDRPPRRSVACNSRDGPTGWTSPRTAPSTSSTTRPASPKSYQGISPRRTPIGRGTKLQLPVYGQAAREHARGARRSGQGRVLVHVHEGKFKRIGYRVTEDVLQRVGDTLGTIVEGIEAGVFPHLPDRVEHPALRGVSLLRSRRARSGRSAPGVGAQDRTTPRWPRSRAGHSRTSELDAGRRWLTSRPPTRARGTESRRTSARPCSSRRAPGRARPPSWWTGSWRWSTTGSVELGQHRRHHLHRKGRDRTPRPAAAATSNERSSPRPSGERRATAPTRRSNSSTGRPSGRSHSFAQRILSEHPIEAGLPPRVEVSRRGQLGGRLRRQVALILRRAARRSGATSAPSWSGCRRRAFREPPPAGCRPSTTTGTWSKSGFPNTSPEPPDVHAAVASVLDELDRSAAEPCADDGDSLRLHLDDIAEYVAWLRTIPDELDLLEALGEKGPRKRPTFKLANRGRKRPGPTASPNSALRVREAGDRLEPDPARRGQALRVKRLGTRPPASSPWTQPRTAKGRRTGVPRSVGDRPLAPPRSRGRSRGAEIAACPIPATAPRRVPGHRPDPGRAGRADRRRPTRGSEAQTPPRSSGTTVEVAPGQLFFVGDPKQSIYRFRRADISMFLDAARRFGTATDGTVELSANFRTAAPIIDWINATFGCLIDVAGEADLPVPSQPRYVVARRGTASSSRWTGGGGRRCACARRRGQRGRDPRPARPPTWSPPCPVRFKKAGAWRRRRRSMAPRPTRRHHHPRSGPDLAALPRGRSRHGGNPLPGRVELSRLFVAGCPRLVDGRAGDRRPDQPAPSCRGPAHAPVRVR